MARGLYAATQRDVRADADVGSSEDPFILEHDAHELAFGIQPHAELGYVEAVFVVMAFEVPPQDLSLPGAFDLRDKAVFDVDVDRLVDDAYSEIRDARIDDDPAVCRSL